MVAQQQLEHFTAEVILEKSQRSNKERERGKREKVREKAREKREKKRKEAIKR
jgi:hypothetical protein